MNDRPQESEPQRTPPGRRRWVPFVRWECVIPEKNQNKFYEIRWEWSLFPIIWRRWGRIGNKRCRGMDQVYGSPQEALDALMDVLRRRQVRGYTLVQGADRLTSLSCLPNVTH